MVEVPDRYCRNCGQELQPEDRFCANCGKPVHDTAHVPTPETEVPVPRPPMAGGDDAEKQELIRMQIEKVEGKLFVMHSLAETLQQTADENKGNLDAAFGTDGLQVSMESFQQWAVEATYWLDHMRTLHGVPQPQTEGE